MSDGVPIAEVEIHDEETPTIDRLRPPLQDTSRLRDREPDAKDVERLRQWQRERIERRLKGEYESAVLRLGEVIHGNMSTATRISSIRVEGAKNTRHGFLGSIVAPHLNAGTTSFEDAIKRVREISRTLHRLDIFASVEPTIERAASVLAKDEDVDIVFRVKEKGRMYLKTSTDVGNGEGSASAVGRIRNVFGGAEILEGSVSYGTKTRRSYQARLEAPLTASLDTRCEFALYELERDNTAFASCREKLRGARAVLRSQWGAGLHEFAYEGVLRHIGDLAPTASVSMREEAGSSTKSAISYSYMRDTRDDVIAGSKGSYTKLFTEFAGLGGDAFFSKTESIFQCSRQLRAGLSLSLGARSGLLWQLSDRSYFSDRFQLGGPTSVRMFKLNSMGPRDGEDSLGGEMYWALGASLISDIPRKADWPLKLQAFANAGRLDSIDRTKSLTDSIAKCVSQPSISAGVGLLYRFDPVRIELNFGVPLVAAKSDGFRKGFQVGMGLEFL